MDCSNCDCPDKSQCPKGNSSGVVVLDAEKSNVGNEVMAVSAAAEHGGPCKCGASCNCVDCNCGN